MDLVQDLAGMGVFSTLELMPNSHSEVDHFAGRVIDCVTDGHKDPLTVWSQMNHLENLIKKVKEGIESEAINELSKYNAKEMPIKNGYQFSLVNISTKYDFSACCDSIFDQLSKSAELTNQQIKDRTEWLKTLKHPSLNEETGELIYPPIKEQKLGLKLTKK